VSLQWFGELTQFMGKYLGLECTTYCPVISRASNKNLKNWSLVKPCKGIGLHTDLFRIIT
jgi:hypothetical protein